MKVQLSSLKLDFALINLISKQKRKDVGVPDILIVSVTMILTPFSTLKSNLLNKDIVITYRKLKTFYGTEKSTVSPSYLP